MQYENLKIESVGSSIYSKMVISICLNGFGRLDHYSARIQQ